MRVLFVIAEMAPLVKVGGLADIGGALPRALRELGVDVRVALPFYAAIDRTETAKIAGLPDGGALWRTDVAGVPVYLFEQSAAFDRQEIYGYDDDAARFLAFCDGVLAAAAGIFGTAEPGEADWQPDVLHLNDWHPGFIAARLAGDRRHPWTGAARVCTIHNLGFTGPVDQDFVRQHGLAASEPDAPDSALARSIRHADLISTVSPTYARELLTDDYGWDLAPLLRRYGDRLCGILSGIDAEAFNPATDSHLAATFDANQLHLRADNKLALQQRLRLPEGGETPVLAMVSRLFWQKGSDLAAAAVEDVLAAHPLQFVVLGQGDEEHTRPLLALAARYPQQVAVRLDFDEPLGQLIFGGCDLFLMPSRYEPGGLGQLVAMRYGAVPIVRHTGGLADSVAPYEPAGAGGGQGTGFLFDEATPQALAAAIEQALAVYGDTEAWRRLQRRGMAQDFSWSRAAERYRDLYQRAVGLRAEGG
ncbi:MAG: glycogen synthase [Chloroflexi bacterium]|nr:glycogen synthase [Chloroflexota bacterium]